MFDFLKRATKSKAPQWNDLDRSAKQRVASRLTAMVKAMGGPRYKLVSGTDEWQRERGQIEHTSEDGILDVYRRGRMLDLARNTARNSPTFNGLLKQFDLNTIGNDGGKAVFVFDDVQQASQMKSKFAQWTRDADFFDGLSLNTLLKIILKTYILGGDCVLLFDDGLIEDSGRVLLYEPDEIGSTTDEAIAQHYGKFASQSQGRVYNMNGRFIGAVVSRSQRGATVFDPTKCFFLQKDPDVPQLDSKWLMPRNVFRVAQGRGVSPVASSIATTIDLEDLCGYELAAAKKNAQTLATVLQDTTPPAEDSVMPSVFDKDTDFENMTDEEIEAAVKAEQSVAQQTMTLDKVQAAGCIYQVLPEGYKLELLDTKHPNQNMPEFIRWLAGRSAAPFGLANLYATLRSDSGNFRAEQLMTWPAFYEAQHFLEQICDWVLWRWAAWATKKGIFDTSKLSANWLANIQWMWPTMDEIDEVAHQNAVEKKLKNLTGSYLETYGPDWREKLLQIQKEVDFCKEHGLPHPSYEMKSGGERTGADTIEE